MRLTPCCNRILAVLLIAACYALAAPLMRAQTDTQLSQYYAVPTFFNPAAAGSTDFLRIRGGARLQWLGVDNSPRTFALTADMPLKLFNKYFGVGLMFNQESYGLYRSFDLGAQISYRFKIRKLPGQFAAGVQIGAFDQSFKGSKVYIPDDDDYHQSTDDAIPTTDIHGTALDIGAGLWYMHKYFNAGISCTHLNSPTITMNAENGGSGDLNTERHYEFKANRTLYFMADGNIPIKNTLFEVMPSVLVKTDFTFTTGEVDVRCRYKKFLSAGVGYRYKDAIIATIAAEIKGFYVGYSYDYSMSEIGKMSNGSHELFVGYSMKLNLGDKNPNRHKSVRVM